MGKRSDGNAVEVTLAVAVSKDDPVASDGFVGVAMRDGEIGDVIAIAVDGGVYSFNVGAEAAAKGAILNIANDSNTLLAAASDNQFGIVTRAKDANNVAWVKLLAVS